MRYVFVIACLAVVFFVNSAGADNLTESRKIINRTNRTLQVSQEKIDQADEQARRMLDEYKTVVKEIDNYRIYNRQLTDIITSQDEEMRILENDIAEIDATGRKIMPFMQKMIDGLACFVASDLPFLKEERQARIETLQASMRRADLSIAAKFRQILEAYQIEIDYGKTIEAYAGDRDGKKVDYLKIGRIGLYSLSLDRKTCAAWHPEKRQWQQLDDMDYTLAVSKAVKIARKQRAPDIFFAAVPRPGVE